MDTTITDQLLNLLDNATRGEIEHDFQQVTGLIPRYEGDDLWIVKGRFLGLPDMINRIISGLIAKSPEEQNELSKTVNDLTSVFDDQILCLNYAVRTAMNDPTLDISKIKVDLYKRDKGEHAPYVTADVLFASKNCDLVKASKDALDFANNLYPSVDIEGGVIAVDPVLTSHDIKKVRQAIDSADGITIEGHFNQVTGAQCHYQGNGAWEINGELIDKNEITVKILESLCIKSPHDLIEVMNAISEVADDSNRLG